jgi:hypothetical protein
MGVVGAGFKIKGSGGAHTLRPYEMVGRFHLFLST